ncbi:MAG: 2-oxoacid:acceptor oxidoreductase family protein [Planctomycetes bacterium]|nr:2-oxoacid:acceptor oxidoreductase family protein [Planctomycetota bacterium]
MRPDERLELRIHGRGGQGAVLASLILADAAHREGYHVQVFPEFGVERRGAPVAAFARLGRSPIRDRTKVYTPHHVMVLDAALVRSVDVTAGLQPNGWILLNHAGRDAGQDGSPLPEGPWRVATVDATSIAAEHGIGTSTAPIVNTTMAGAFARVTALVSIDAICDAIRERIGAKAESNIAGARAAFDAVSVRPAPTDAALQAMYR